MKGLRGLYKHIKTQKLYFVDGVARDVTNPQKISVVYTQLYDSKLKTRCHSRPSGTQVELPEDKSVDLPKGSMWLRDVDDFNKKFEKIPQTRFNKFTTTISTTLEKDILYGYNKKV
jgi:hypothetical protein